MTDQVLDSDFIPYVVDSSPDNFREVFYMATGNNYQSIPELKYWAEDYRQKNGWGNFVKNITDKLDYGKVNQSQKMAALNDVYQNSRNLATMMRELKSQTKEQIQAAADELQKTNPKGAITIMKFATLEPGPWSPEYIESQSEALNPQVAANQGKSWSEIINTALGVTANAAGVALQVAPAVQAFANPQGYNQQQIQNQQAQAQIQQQSQQQQNTFLIVVSVIGALLVIGVLWLLLKNKK